MTSASELFYKRRSRIDRDSTTDPEFEPYGLFYSRRNRASHSHRHDFDGCEPPRRYPHSRNPCNRLSSVSERASVRVDLASSQRRINTEGLSSSSRSRARFTGNDRLPGAVLLARARLVERLRGVSASSNRGSSRVSFDISNRDYTFGDDLRIFDAADFGAGSVWSTRGTPSSSSTNQTERLQLTGEPYNKKPPGLTSEDINSLQLEIFIISEDKGKTSWLSCDCSICLESFEEGDKLIHLPCEHRFHDVCLDRWIRTCGNCPYCRQDIVVK